ncbi:MAG TPA: oxidoreductase [Pseudonocardia sp.]|nr:oxidoreductase [Pseudonocardia sp.]
MAGVRPDPLAPLVGLPGVEDAVRRAREAVVALHRHPVNRTGWAASAAEAALRAARASAALDGAELARADGVVSDPVLAGAVRAAEATGRLLGTWRTAPLQALARLHVLAAADLGDADAGSGAALGRPVRGTERLALLAELVTGGTAVPAPVLVAVVHGELLALEPFPSANGVVGRAAARLAAISSGLDPRGLAVPEVGHLRAGSAYRDAARGFATGTPEALAAWIRHCCDQWVAGAREGRSIADARAK